MAFPKGQASASIFPALPLTHNICNGGTEKWPKGGPDIDLEPKEVQRRQVTKLKSNAEVEEEVIRLKTIKASNNFVLEHPKISLKTTKSELICHLNGQCAAKAR